MPSIRDAIAFPSGAACRACGLGSADMTLLSGITSSPMRRSQVSWVWPTWTRHPLAEPGSDQEDITEPGLPAASWSQRLTGRVRRGRLRSHRIPRGVAGAPAAPRPAAPDRAGTLVQVRIGTVAAARAGRGLRRAGIGTRPRRPANTSHGNLLVVTGSHVGNHHYLEGIRALVTRSIPDATPGRGLGPLPPRERPECDSQDFCRCGRGHLALPRPDRRPRTITMQALPGSRG